LRLKAFDRKVREVDAKPGLLRAMHLNLG